MFVMLFCLDLAALRSPAGKALSFVCDFSCVFVTFQWCSGSGVVFDCIDS